MKIDLDKIESDAKAVRDEGTWGPIIRAVRELNLCVEEVDHIANCSPDVVLELVERLRLAVQLAHDLHYAYEEAHIESIKERLDALLSEQGEK